jgi:hypothetical protein
MRLMSVGGRFCGLFLLTSQVCCAAACLGPAFGVQAGAEKSTWQEFASNGQLLVREEGTIPFAALEAKLACDRSWLTARARMARGDWDYSGSSSAGGALNTTSGRQNAELMLTYSYAASPGFEPFFSAGIWRSERDIRSTGSVLGYPEEYRMYPLHVGLKWRPAALEDRLLLAARAGSALQPRVSVQLPGRDPLTLDLGRTVSSALSAELEIVRQALGQFVLAASWERTRIDASSAGVVTRNGVPVGVASQPRIRLTSAEVSLIWRKLL